MCSPKMSWGMLFLSNKRGPNHAQKPACNGSIINSITLPKIPIIKTSTPLPSLLHQIIPNNINIFQHQLDMPLHLLLNDDDGDGLSSPLTYINFFGLSPQST